MCEWERARWFIVPIITLALTILFLTTGTIFYLGTTDFKPIFVFDKFGNKIYYSHPYVAWFVLGGLCGLIFIISTDICFWHFHCSKFAARRNAEKVRAVFNTPEAIAERKAAATIEMEMIYQRGTPERLEEVERY